MSFGQDVTIEAIVLAATDVGEEDRILTFITPTFGLLRAAASSARNLKRGKAASLDLFVQINLNVRVPRKEGRLKRVGVTQVIDPFLGIRSDYLRLCVASYLGQTVAHCVQEDDRSPGTYELVRHSLKLLDTGASPYSVMLLFEVRFLREMGLSPELDFCQKCGKMAEGDVYISAAGGGVLHSKCMSGTDETLLSPGDLAVLRYLSVKSVRTASNLSVREKDARRLFQLLHPFSVHHLGYEAKALKMIEKGTRNRE